LSCVQNVQPSPEDCNNLDDDCDGQVDEGNPGGGGSCLMTLFGICSAGTIQCQGGSLSCVQNIFPIVEICNGLDDDCNGITDEGLGGGACDGPDSDLCMEGVSSCVIGLPACNDNTGSSVDICNGFDDDCDSASADGSEDPQNGVACDGGDSDFCMEGTKVCTAGVMTCTDVTDENVESCNGLDDDCDGIVDESASSSCSSIPNGSPVCSGGTCQVGFCNAGFGDCDGSNANGCEISLLTSNSHCGSCGNWCTTNQTCFAGVCMN